MSFVYNQKKHSAYDYNPATKFGDTSDRHYSTQMGLAGNPEYQAYISCREAYIHTIGYVPENVTQSLKTEMEAWKKSCLKWMNPINEIEWMLDDTNSAHNPFNRFKGHNIIISLEGDYLTCYSTSNNAYAPEYSIKIKENRVNVQIGPGRLFLEDSHGNKAWLKFAK